MRYSGLTATLLLLSALAACSGGEEETSSGTASGDHVWKAQTDALDKAKEVEGIMQDAEQTRRRAEEQQTQ